jgi:hypothetical protein
MGRKGAILMLAVVALWAVAPALACLAVAPCHSCCRDMMMDCDSTAMDAAQPCCQLQSSNVPVPATSVIAPELQTGLIRPLASAVLPDLDGLASPKSAIAEAPPPRSLSGASTILRI